MAPPAPKGKFNEGEKVLCYHGPLLYEAKCVKSKKDNNSILYFIHYQGWNKNWDEWVPENRILKQSQDNLQKKEQLLKEHYADSKKSKKKGGPPGPGSFKESGKRSGGGSANTSRASTPVSERSFKVTPSATKKGAVDDDHSTSSREEESKRSAKRTRLSESLMDDTENWKFRIDMPEDLKYVLVKDMKLVTMENKLFALPAKTTIASILNEYTKHVEKNQLDNFATISEVMLGVKDMFDGIVYPQLLYKCEFQQFDKVKKGESPSNVYGSPHLLRLLVKIGPLLNHSSMDTTSEANVELIENIINDFLLYLNTNSEKLFTSKNYKKNDSTENATTD